MRSIRRVVIVRYVLCVLLWAVGCGGDGKTIRTVSGLRGTLYRGTEAYPASGPLDREERERRDTAIRLDRERLLESARVVMDGDPALLEPPEHLKPLVGKDFTVARTAPGVQFGVIPAQPAFFRELNGRDQTGWWGNYAQSAFQPETGKFYAAVGDHGKIGACIYIVEYDPSRRSIRCLPEINRTLGRGEERFGDGIIHGWLDFFQGPGCSRPHLWFCTYWSRFPEPLESDYETGYDGGHILSCDPETGDVVDYGAPLRRVSWPYHRVDASRGMLYAVGMNGEFLAWDIAAGQPRWAGHLPPGLAWYNRAVLLDEETGRVYTSNGADSDPDRHMIVYDPEINRFSRLDCVSPVDPETGKREPMRAQTRNRGPDGLFWGVTVTGQLFTFDPEREIMADRGACWPGSQRYTCSLERSPGGRYLYYAPQTYRDGSPLVQLDTRTGVRKVLAFLAPYYSGQYGYIPAVSYSLKLDPKGERLFMVWNGGFTGMRDDLGVERFGNCAVMLMDIPKSERDDDRM